MPMAERRRRGLRVGRLREKKFTLGAAVWPVEGEAENPKSQKQGFLLISFSREGLCYVGKVVAACWLRLSVSKGEGPRERL